MNLPTKRGGWPTDGHAAVAPSAPDRVVTVDADAAGVAEAAATRVLDLMRAALSARSRCSVVLAGGSTPVGLHAALVRRASGSGIDWSNVRWFFGDERAVAPDDPRSNYRSARETLLDPLNIARDHVARMEAERPDLERAADDYERRLRAELPVRDGMPAPDVIVLGVGTDGHTLSLYPGCAAIDDGSHAVVALRTPPMNPAVDRLSLTPVVVRAAGAVIVVAYGANKRDAVRGLLAPIAASDANTANDAVTASDANTANDAATSSDAKIASDSRTSRNAAEPTHSVIDRVLEGARGRVYIALDADAAGRTPADAPLRST